MSRIKLLPDSVANQIAAGEVVTRPAAAVKEVMENAVDAGARCVTVNFRDGGRELIQIKDDGCGMSAADARMAFERHATSKIRNVEDIYQLSTFGFRGEALASIAAVAQVELHTRQEGDELGTKLNVDGGAFSGAGAVAAPVGTQMWIRNLFYNVPARKKFLNRGESTHIINEFQRVALAHPEVSFQLYKDDAPVYNLPAGGLHQRVMGVAGRGSAAKFLDVGVNTSLVRVTGFVGRPEAARRRSEQFLFVNGRYFESANFRKAIVGAYDKLIPATVQPPYFIYLEIDPEEIDVNVSPQKTEVKFANQAALWQIINAAVRETLAKSGAVPMMDFEAEDRLEIPVASNYSAPVREPAMVRERGYNPFQYDGPNRERGPATFLTSEGCAPQFAPPVVPSRGLGDDFGDSEFVVESDSEFEFIASDGGEEQRIFESEVRTFSDIIALGEGYAAARWGEVFVVIDLRRAREAVLYDRYIAMLRAGQSAVQGLLFPERMALGADDAELLKDNIAEFEALGFDIRAVGDHSFEVCGAPADMPSERLDEAVYAMLDELRDGVFDGPESRRQRLAAQLVHSCAGRVAAGEAANLLAALAETSSPSFTPRGKAVMFEIGVDEIRSRLK